MSKLEKTESKGYKKIQKAEVPSGYKIAIVALSLVVVLLLAIMIFGKTTEPTEIPQEYDEYFGFSEPAALQASAVDTELTIAKTGSALNLMRASSIYFYAINGQDAEGNQTYTAMMYNDNGECVTQDSVDGYITIYRNDNKAIRFNENMSYGYDSEVLTLLECLHRAMQDGIATVLAPNSGDVIEGYHTGVIDICGWDNITKFYSYISSEFAVDMVSVFKQTVAMQNAKEDGTAKETSFRFYISIGDESGLIESCVCYVYVGDKHALDVEYSDLMFSWAYEGLTVMNDWDLLEDWYTINWDTLADFSTEEIENVQYLLDDQFDVCLATMKEWAIENGYDPNEIFSENANAGIDITGKGDSNTSTNGSTEDAIDWSDITSEGAKSDDEVSEKDSN